MVTADEGRRAAALSARRPSAARNGVQLPQRAQAGRRRAVRDRHRICRHRHCRSRSKCSPASTLRVVAQQVEDALRRYLWPLQPGGTLQTGWPLGRTVRSLELEVIVSQVPGVVEVNGVQLFLKQQDNSYATVRQAPRSRRSRSSRYQLPELLRVKVVAGPDGSGVAPAASLEPERRLRCRRGRACRAEGVLMDSNGLRFWMLSSESDWTLDKPAADSTVRRGLLRFPPKRLHLRSTPDGPLKPEAFSQVAGLLDAVPYRARSIRHLRAGTPVRPRDGRRRRDGRAARGADLHAAAARGGDRSGARVRWRALPRVDGQLIFSRSTQPLAELHAAGIGGRTSRCGGWRRTPTAAWSRSIATIIDCCACRDCRCRICRRFPMPADVMRPCEENADPPRVSATLALPAEEYLRRDCRGRTTARVAVLSWHRNAADNDAVRLRMLTSLVAVDSVKVLDGPRLPVLPRVAREPADCAARVAEQESVHLRGPARPDAVLDADGRHLRALADVNAGPVRARLQQPPHYNVGADLFPLVPLSLNSLARAGTARNASTRLDSRGSRTAWHRLYLEASLPQRCVRRGVARRRRRSGSARRPRRRRGSRTSSATSRLPLGFPTRRAPSGSASRARCRFIPDCLAGWSATGRACSWSSCSAPTSRCARCAAAISACGST